MGTFDDSILFSIYFLLFPLTELKTCWISSPSVFTEMTRWLFKRTWFWMRIMLCTLKTRDRMSLLPSRLTRFWKIQKVLPFNTYLSDYNNINSFVYRMAIGNLAKFHAVSHAMIHKGGIDDFKTKWPLNVLEAFIGEDNPVIDSMTDNCINTCMNIVKVRFRKSLIKYDSSIVHLIELFVSFLVFRCKEMSSQIRIALLKHWLVTLEICLPKSKKVTKNKITN